MTYTVLTFDLDGTLVDTADEIAAAANRTLEDFGLPRQPAAQIAALIGNGTRELMLKLLADVPLEQRPRGMESPMQRMLERFDHHYGQIAGTTCRAYPASADALAQLARSGVQLACVTNKELRFAHRVLQATGLDAAFDLVVGGDSLEHKKPHRQVIEHVLRTLGGRPDQAAHVGDSRIDVEAARNAGVAAWVVPYGYNAGAPIEAARPQRIFADLAEVAAHVIAVNAMEIDGAASQIRGLQVRERAPQSLQG